MAEQYRLPRVLVGQWLAVIAAGRAPALALAGCMAAEVSAGMDSPEAERWRDSWVAWCGALYDVGVAAMREQAELCLAPPPAPPAPPPDGDVWQ